MSTFRDDALGDMDAVGMIEALANRSVSAEELRDAALSRARIANEALNAVVCWVPEPTIGTGPFAGIPSFIKDNDELAGLPMRDGSRAMPAGPAHTSSEFAAQFQELGFTVLGKSTLPEFGLTASCEPLLTGPTRNPRDPDRTPGGSSGGSAALVAAGAVPLAHSNDGGGSTRIPASCCGLVGLKPSNGRLIARPTMKKLPVPLTAQGVVTRTVRDTALYYSEAEKLYRELPPMGHVTGPGKERRRIGVLLTGLPGLPVAPDVSEEVTRIALVCEQLGHHVEVIPMPFDKSFGRDFLRYWAAIAFLEVKGGKRLFGPDFDAGQVEPLTQGLAEMFGGFALRMPTTIMRLRRFAVEYQKVFDKHDILLSPVLSHTAPPIGYLAPDLDPRTHLVRLLRFASFTAVQNISGAPAISLPLGRGDDGLPIGVQAAGPLGQEARLLELAYELEDAVGFQ